MSADMRQIRLYQSTWADAQRLMKRWGAWGRYEGSCTTEGCTYLIEMSDISSSSAHHSPPSWVNWLLVHDRFNLYHWLGGRGAQFKASFTVRNGTIWRESTGIAVVASSRKEQKEDVFDRTLSVFAQSRQRLHPTIEDPFSFMGPDEQLAQHPFYRVGRPSGCMINCEIASINFSTRTPPAEIERLTSFNLSCFTRFNPCAELGDVLPAAKDWHLYDEEPSDPNPPTPNPLPKVSCGIPVWALARDARYVLVVEALATKTVRDHGFEEEMTEVRVVDSLKGRSPWLPGAIVAAYPFPGADYDSPTQKAEHLVPGRRFIMFPIGDDRRDQRVTKDSPITLDRCGLQEDNPEMRREIEKGFAQNDPLNP